MINSIHKFPDAIRPSELPEDMAMSNPISILTRRCQILGQTPQFELQQVEGAAHCPLFTVEASLSGMGEQLAAEGKGGSKRIAKEEAARNLLLQLETSPQPTIDNVAFYLFILFLFKGI